MRIIRTSTLSLAVGLAIATAAAAQTPKPAYDPRAAMAESDANKDGYVDYHEFIERLTEVYYLNDANKDGSLSTGEAASAMIVTDNLLVADSNGDGRITVHEFLRARVDDFQDADTDKDGLLSIEEVVTVYERKKP